MTILYDKMAIKQNTLLDLPMREGIRAVTRDIAKPHHPVTLVNTPTWTQLASGINVIDLDGVNQYLRCLNADSLDLDFIAGDYSIGMWFNWTHGAASQILIGRYELNVGGWELYLTEVGALDYLTLRHHHAGTIVDGNPRTAGNSLGWTPGVWWHLGISRHGGVAVHYRNGVAQNMTYSTGGLVDPETTTQNLTIGSRYDLGGNWLDGMIQGITLHDRALTAVEWLAIYNDEVGSFA